MALRVVLADDQTIIREGLQTLLSLDPSIEVVAAVGDGQAAVEAVAEHGADVALLDLRMPVLDGVGATAAIAPTCAVVVLTTYADDASVLAALKAGAKGYLTKDAGRAEIVRALHAAASGQTTLDPVASANLLSALGKPEPVAPAEGLTPRETEVLVAMAEGLSNHDIAKKLFVSEATVKTHINNTFGKLGVTSRAAAVAYAYRTGLAEPSS